MAIQFDGVNEYYAEGLGTALDVGAADDFSVGFWFKQTNTAGAQRWLDGNGAVAGSARFVYTGNDHGSVPDIMAAEWYGDTGSPFSLIGTTNVSGTGWHLVVLVRDDSGPRLSLFIAAAGGTATEEAFNTSADAGTAMTPSVMYIGADSSSGQLVNGDVAELFWIVGRALTVGEITAMAKGVGILTIAVPTFYVPMRTAANDLVDLMGTGEHPTIQAGTPVTVEHPPVSGGAASQYVAAPAAVVSGEGAAMYHHLQRLGAY